MRRWRFRYVTITQGANFVRGCIKSDLAACLNVLVGTDPQTRGKDNKTCNAEKVALFKGRKDTVAVNLL